MHYGTHADNVADTVSRDRHVYGERSPHAKLTDEDVCEILELRRQGRTIKSIAVEYGVSNALIGFVSKGDRWGHVVVGADQ